MKLRIFLTAALTLLLAGCLLTDDIRPTWQQGGIDPELEGVWLKHEVSSGKEIHVQFMKNGDHYLAANLDENMRPKKDGDNMIKVKTLTIDESKYLLMGMSDDPDNYSGAVMPYREANGKLEFLTLEPHCSACTSILISGGEIKNCDKTVCPEGLAEAAKWLRDNPGTQPKGMKLSDSVPVLDEASMKDMHYIYTHYPHWTAKHTLERPKTP